MSVRDESSVERRRQWARVFSAALAASDLTQGEVARRMVALGFPTYSQMTVSRTKGGERSILVEEYEALASILDLPTIGSGGSVSANAAELNELRAFKYRIVHAVEGSVLSAVATAYGLRDASSQAGRTQAPADAKGAP